MSICKGDKLNLALCQMASTNTSADNLDTANAFLDESRGRGADLIVFPENVLCRGSYDDIRNESQSQYFYTEQLGRLSKKHDVNVVWGGIPVRYPEGLFNVAMVLDHHGQLLAVYRKIHLFKLDLGFKSVDEGSLFQPGSIPIKFQLGNWNIGLTICYDLRFPELFRAYAGVDLILCPADFTYYTGKAHWEVLLRARAIENQCFVAGVNQCGLNKSMNVKSNGHSQVVDPWGTHVVASEDQEMCISCELDPVRLKSVRTQLPALSSITRRITW